MTQIDCYDQAQDNVIITPEKYQEFIITPDQLVPDSIASYCFNLFKRDLNKLHHRIKRQGRLKPKQRIQLVELIKLPVLHSQLKEHGRFATPIFFNTHSRHATKPEGHVIGNGRMLVSSCYAPDTLYDFVHYTKDYGDRSVIERMVHELGSRQERKDYSLVNCLVDEENDVYYSGWFYCYLRRDMFRWYEYIEFYRRLDKNIFQFYVPVRHACVAAVSRAAAVFGRSRGVDATRLQE